RRRRPRGRASRSRHRYWGGPGGRSSASEAPREAKRDRGAEPAFGHSSTVGRWARTGAWLDATRTGRHHFSRGWIVSSGGRAPGPPRPGRSARRLLAAPDLHGLSDSGMRAGVGPGLLLRLLGGERAALVGTGSWRWLPLASPSTSYELGVEARVHIGPVSVAARWRKAPRAEEVGLVLLMYRD